MTSGDTTNATSLQEAASGPSQPDLLAGLIPESSGPAPAHAKAKASRGNASEPMIQGICGRTYIASSVPAGPLSSWESKLRQRLALIGSTESALIWRTKTTPSGRSISRLAPSMRHTNGTESTGSRWTTVAARDGRSDRSQKSNEEIYGAKGRPLPRLMLEQMEAVHAFNPSYNRSPTAGEKRGGSYSDPAKAAARMQSGHTINLEDQMVVAAAYSPTPTSLSFKDSHQPGNSRSPNLMRAHFETALGGPTPTGSSAPSTAKRGAPNPAFPFWLMGFPDEWTSGALAAMRYLRSLPRKSSRRSSKAKPT